MRQRVSHALQASIALLGFVVFRALPVDLASWVGGALLRWIGPRLKVSHIARRNLRAAFPNKTDDILETIVRQMWDHLGRVLGEFPHSATLMADPNRVQVTRPDIIAALRDDGRPGIFFSAHIGNWELASVFTLRHGLPFAVFYRAPNNPLVERLYRHQIHGAGGVRLLAKGSKGAREALAILKQGGHLGMLVDQKMNDGIPVPFFGRDAMTAPALAQFAHRYDCPVVPIRIIRIKGAHFKLAIDPPLVLPATGDKHADVIETMRRVNACLEGWIRETPEQWLWVHRRWPDLPTAETGKE